ncbi:MAG: protein NO VEIN domain-containing protein [Solirubrobacteraceae bacterium]
MLAGTADDAVTALIARLTASAPEIASRLDGATLSDLVLDTDDREELLLQLARRVSDEHNALVGDAGERLVVAEARAELEQLGRPDVARQVRRVSLTSDQLGYDIRAPRLQGAPRRIEVKATTTSDNTEQVRIFISRNEAETGLRMTGWSLVVCLITDTKDTTGSVLGWWSYDDLAERLPQDVHGGAWRLAELILPLKDARPGLPSAVL